MARHGVRRLFALKFRGKHRVEDEVDDELNAHLEFRVARLMQQGLSQADAERGARDRFGAFDEASALLKQSALKRERTMHWREWVDAVQQDTRLAVRQVWRAPGFALAVVLTLALGIGANAAMFGIVDRLLLRPPSGVVHPERIVVLGARWTTERSGEVTQTSFPYHTYMSFRDGLTKASRVAMSTYPASVPIGRGGDAELVSGIQTNAAFFALAGATPALGRFFSGDDDREPVGQAVVVISYGLWQRRFGGDRSAIGQQLNLNNHAFTVIGVAPRGFSGFELSAVDVWIPITSPSGMRFMADSVWMTTRNATWILVYAGLKPGVSPEQLAAEATPINYSDGEPRQHDVHSAAIATPLLQKMHESRGPVVTVAKLLTGLSLIVVLIACTNVINLLLSRSASRKQEVAIRLALGVSRARLAVQLLTESLLLALLGGVGACAVAWIGGTLARTLIFGDEQFAGLPVDARLVAYIAALTTIAAIITGLVPLLQARSLTLTATLRTGARDGKRAGDTTRGMILVFQAALSVVLLVTTGLFAHSLREVYRVPTGMQVNRLILGRMSLPAPNNTPQQRDELFQAMAARVRTMSGIQSASVAATIAGNNSIGTSVHVPGMDSIPTANVQGPYLNAVDADFFATIGARVLQGRNFSGADNATSMRVAIINETMARKVWPGQNAVGQCMQIGKDTEPCTVIVGVVENIRRQNWIEGDIYFVMQPLSQSKIAGRILLVRPRGDIDGKALALVRQTMQNSGVNLPYADVRPLENLYESELRPWRMGAGMLGAFASLALFLVAVGLFATLSFAVNQRTHEIGVRMALGARAGQVIALIMRQGLVLAGIGAAIGGMVALAGGRLVQEMLFNTSVRDAGVFALTLLVLGSVAVAATVLPALRASRISPTRALRAD